MNVFLEKSCWYISYVFFPYFCLCICLVCLLFGEKSWWEKFFLLKKFWNFFLRVFVKKKKKKKKIGKNFIKFHKSFNWSVNGEKSETWIFFQEKIEIGFSPFLSSKKTRDFQREKQFWENLISFWVRISLSTSSNEK